MVDIKLIQKDTDLSKCKIRKIDWDLVVRAIPYQVVAIDGYCHTIGGKWRNNNYWAYPLEKEMTTENLIQFNGEPVKWGIHCEDTSYIRPGNGFHKDTEIRKSIDCYITRNGEKFYEIYAGSYQYALAKAQVCLIQLQEHVIDFFERGWEKKNVGRKVWYRDDPAYIDHFVVDQGCIILKPDGIKNFSVPANVTEDDEHLYDDYRDSVKVEYLSENIYWFRDKKKRYGKRELLTEKVF